MSKEKLRFDNLRLAMEDVQSRRASEVGGHTWKIMVERYGLDFLFVEIASITGRLEQSLWRTYGDYPFYQSLDFDRMLDLCIDLGNYADFLYQSLMTLEKKVADQRLRDNEGE